MSQLVSGGEKGGHCGGPEGASPPWVCGGVAPWFVLQFPGDYETVDGLRYVTWSPSVDEYGKVEPYDVGEYKDLKGKSPSPSGDKLDVHHVPQKNPAGQTIADYDGKTAPAIALPKGEHEVIPTEKGTATRTPRDQLAK